MKSYIKSRKKYILEPDSKIWLAFIFIFNAILFGFNLFLDYKINFFIEEANNYSKLRQQIKNEIKKIKDEIKKAKEKKAFIENIYASNEVVKNSIKNLFDLIPDEITLSKVIIKKDSLTLYGITPSKETYSFLLLTPLKSIFSTNKTYFYQLQNGWYKFISINIFPLNV